VLQLLIALSVSDPDIVKKLVGPESGDAIGKVAAVFLGSGGLGYVLANAYFALYWWPPLAALWAIDHKSLFVQLGTKVQILNPDGTPRPASDLTLRDAWTIVTQFWHSRIGPHDEAKELNRITDRLVDVTHSLGAASVGAFVGFLAWILIHCRYGVSGTPLWILLLVGLGWALVIGLFLISHRRTNAALQAIANATVGERIAETDPSNLPVRIYYIP
jgi:hypothetical protein